MYVERYVDKSISHRQRSLVQSRGKGSKTSIYLIIYWRTYSHPLLYWQVLEEMPINGLIFLGSEYYETN